MEGTATRVADQLGWLRSDLQGQVAGDPGGCEEVQDREWRRLAEGLPERVPRHGGSAPSQHRHVPRRTPFPMQAVTTNPHYSLVLEYCSKGSLWSYLQNKENQITWEERRRLAVEIAQGVLYLH